MKYLLANPAKFHSFEVGRELIKNNQLNKIICGYPWFKLKHEGINENKIISLSLITILKKIIKKKKIRDILNIYQFKKIDLTARKFLDNTNVFIGLSTCGLQTGIEAKKRGIVYICERSSSHIQYQNEILKREYQSLNLYYQPIPKEIIEREIHEYNEADFILVPSNFVKNSFTETLKKKVKVLNFGVNTDNFFKDYSIIKSKKYFDILFIGQISLRKGLHYLIDAFEKFNHPNKRLHIIGSHTYDKEFFIKKLKNSKIKVYGHVNHLKLNKIINMCHVFVLPSIEEGFATVILQVLSAGCPVIVSENTGAKEFVGNNKCGFVVPIRDSKAITEKLEVLSEDITISENFQTNALNKMKKQTWENYVLQLNKLVSQYKNGIFFK